MIKYCYKCTETIDTDELHAIVYPNSNPFDPTDFGAYEEYYHFDCFHQVFDTSNEKGNC